MSENKLSRPEPAVNGTDYQFNSDTHELKGADPEAFRAAQAKAVEAQLAAAKADKEKVVAAYLANHTPEEKPFPDISVDEVSPHLKHKSTL